jgi:hypothetical protein
MAIAWGTPSARLLGAGRAVILLVEGAGAQRQRWCAPETRRKKAVDTLWYGLAAIILLVLGSLALAYFALTVLPEDDRLFPFDD